MGESGGFQNRSLVAGSEHGSSSIHTPPASQHWSSWDFFTDSNYTTTGGGPTGTDPIRDIWGGPMSTPDEEAVVQVTIAAVVIALVVLALTLLGAFKKLKTDMARRSLVDDLRDIERRKKEGKIESEKAYEREKQRALTAFRKDEKKPLGTPPPPAPLPATLNTEQAVRLYTAADREDTAPLMSDEYPHLPTRRVRPLWRRVLDRVDRDINDPAVTGALSLIITVSALTYAAVMVPATLLKAIAVGASGVAVACLVMYFSSVTEGDRARTGTATTLSLGANASSVEGKYVGWSVTITSGAGEGQTRSVTTYDCDARVITVGPQWSCDPDATSRYVLCAPSAQWGRLTNDRTWASEQWRHQRWGAAAAGSEDARVGEYIEAAEGRKYYGALGREDDEGEARPRGCVAAVVRNAGAFLVGLASSCGWYCVLATAPPPDVANHWGGGGEGSAPRMFYPWVSACACMCCMVFLLSCGRYFSPEGRLAFGLALLAIGLGGKPLLDLELQSHYAWVTGLSSVAVLSVGWGLAEGTLPFALLASGGGGEGYATFGSHLAGVAVLASWYGATLYSNDAGFPMFFGGALLLLGGVVGGLIVVAGGVGAGRSLPPPLTGAREGYVVSLLLPFVACQGSTQVATFASLPSLVEWGGPVRGILVATFVASEALGSLSSRLWSTGKMCKGASLLSTGAAAIFLSLARAVGVACVLLTARGSGSNSLVAWTVALGYTHGALSGLCTDNAPWMLANVKGGGGEECGEGEVLHATLLMRTVRAGGVCAGLSAAYMLRRTFEAQQGAM